MKLERVIEINNDLIELENKLLSYSKEISDSNVIDKDLVEGNTQLIRSMIFIKLCILSLYSLINKS